jgi:replicative DNA helicase
VLKEEDFPESERPIFKAIANVVLKDDAIDPSRVVAEIAASGHPEPFKLLAPIVATTAAYASDPIGRMAILLEIRNQRVKREILERVGSCRFEEAHEYLKALEAPDAGDGTIDEDRIADFMDLIEGNSQKVTLGLPTGLAKLDDATGGLAPSQVWAVGAPTSAGKTTLLCQTVTEASKNGAVCLYFSLEMPLPVMYARLVGAYQGINPTRIYRGRLTPQEKTTVQGTLGLLRESGLRVFRDVHDVPEIVRRCREAKISQGRVDVVAVDFIQNATVAGADNMLIRMAEAARMLQAVSGELKACVLVASQLSNESVREKGTGIYSYRYASELAHAADVGIELVPQPGGWTDLHVKKNRHGKTMTAKIEFTSEFSSFREVS